MANREDLSTSGVQYSPENDQCQKCGGRFHCGLNDSGPCWCASDFPRIISGEAGGSCLCQRCLASLVSERKGAN